jgi:hypothetical protein
MISIILGIIVSIWIGESWGLENWKIFLIMIAIVAGPIIAEEKFSPNKHIKIQSVSKDSMQFAIPNSEYAKLFCSVNQIAHVQEPLVRRRKSAEA